MLNTSEKYLFDRPRLELWAQKGEYIRAWLSTVLIVRREYEEAKKNSKRSRKF